MHTHIYTQTYIHKLEIHLHVAENRVFTFLNLANFAKYNGSNSINFLKCHDFIFFVMTE